ncbi:MAG: hypothetical protein AMXMBFR84_10870 [Candidatus Hydrogenedentota bacterium]
MSRRMRYPAIIATLLSTTLLTMGVGCPLSTLPPEPFLFTFSGTVTTANVSEGETKADAPQIGDTVTLTTKVVLNERPTSPLLQPLLFQIDALNAVNPGIVSEMFHAEFVSSSVESYLQGLGYSAQSPFIGYAAMTQGPDFANGAVDVSSQVVSYGVRNQETSVREWIVGTPVRIVFTLPGGDSGDIFIECANASVTGKQPL